MRQSVTYLPLLLLFLTGCSGNVEKLHELNPPADNFTSALASEYEAYADSEKEQGRRSAAEYYAGKGLKALKGETVEPEMPDADLLPQDQQELADARAQFMKLYTDQIKNAAPQQIARSQLLFDCWQHQLSKDLNQEKAPCAEEFHSSFAQLQETTDPLIYGERSEDVVTFETNSKKLSEESLKTIQDVAAKVAPRHGFIIQLSAYAGKKTSQRKLTEVRIAVVRHALIQAGVHSNSIRVKKEGSAKAVILSGDKGSRDTKQVRIVVKTHSRAMEHAS